MRTTIRVAILSLSLGANLALAQGTYHFEWHGSQIHGGFDTTWEEVNVPGIRWGSQVLLDSLSFTDFSGVVMNTKIDDYAIGGGVSGGPGWWGFVIALVDWSRNVELTTYGHAQDYLGRFQEQVIPSQFFGDERGYWTVDFVPTPEPCTFGLVIMGLLGWWAAKRAAQPSAPTGGPRLKGSGSSLCNPTALYFYYPASPGVTGDSLAARNYLTGLGWHLSPW